MLTENITFLIAITATAASLVAFIGGFVFSRFIASSNERASYIRRRREIRENLKSRETDRDAIKRENEEVDVIIFIGRHIETLWGMHSMDDKWLAKVFDINEYPSLTLETLTEYLESAFQLIWRYKSATAEYAWDLGFKCVTDAFLSEYGNDSLIYKICQKYGHYLEDKHFKDKDSVKPISEIPYTDEASKKRHMENQSKLENLNTTIVDLKGEELRLTDHINILCKPRGRLSGIIIFASVTIISIILPFLFIMFEISGIKGFDSIAAGYVSVGLLFIGIGLIFGYLIWLLTWDEKDEDQPS